MTAMHSNTTNPVRLVEINTRTNSLRTWLYAPWDDTQYPSATMQLRGRSWLRWALFTA